MNDEFRRQWKPVVAYLRYYTSAFLEKLCKILENVSRYLICGQVWNQGPAEYKVGILRYLRNSFKRAMFSVYIHII